MFNEIKAFIKIGLLSALLLSVSAATAWAQPIDKQQLQVFLDEVIKAELEEHNVPNATAAVVVDGELVFLNGYGYADMERQVLVDPAQTMFRIGSISKLFTWTAVMQLVEQGRLDLDTDVNTYLDFEIPSRLYKQNAGIDAASDPAPITMNHLLTHTPGFEDRLIGLFAVSEDKFVPLEEYLKDSIPERIFPAGEVGAYSNYGTALAGYIVERVSGQSFEAYVERYILEPLAMDQSTFRQPLPAHLADDMAKAYRYVGGQFLERGFELMPGPAGGMSATAADMSRFMLAHLQDGSVDGGRILNPETLKLMHTQRFTQHPLVDGMAHGFIEGHAGGQRILTHGGSTMLFDAGLYLLPEHNIGIFMAYSGGSSLVHGEVFQAFMDRYFPERPDLSVEQEQAEGAAKRNKQHAGEYHATRRSVTTADRIMSLLSGVTSVSVDKDGYLSVTDSSGSNRFVEVAPGIYELVRQGSNQNPYGQFTTLIFDTDPSGKPMLVSGGPIAYIKAPWYATRLFTIMAVAGSMIIILGSLIYWLAAFIIRKLKGKRTEQLNLAKAARWTAVAFGVLLLAVLLNFPGTGELDPVYQLPKDAYDPAPASLIMGVLLVVLQALVAAITAFTVLAWVKGFWSLGRRIHYTVFTGAAMLLLWVFNYWNIL